MLPTAARLASSNVLSSRVQTGHGECPSTPEAVVFDPLRHPEMCEHEESRTVSFQNFMFVFAA